MDRVHEQIPSPLPIWQDGVWMVGTRVELRIFADGCVRTALPLWNEARDVPTPGERRRGYLIRGGEIRFSPAFTPQLTPGELRELVELIRRRELDRPDPEGDAKSPADMIDGHATVLRLHTGRSPREIAYGDLARLADESPTGSRPQAAFELVERCKLLAARCVCRRIALADQIQLLRTGSVDSLRDFAGPELIPALLELLDDPDTEPGKAWEAGIVLATIADHGFKHAAVERAMIRWLLGRGYHTGRHYGALASDWVAEYGSQRSIEALFQFFAREPTMEDPPHDRSGPTWWPNPAGEALCRYAQRRIAPAKLDRRARAVLLDGALAGDFRRVSQSMRILAEAGGEDTARWLRSNGGLLAERNGMSGSEPYKSVLRDALHRLDERHGAMPCAPPRS